MPYTTIDRSGSAGLSEYDVFNGDELGACFYCHKLFPRNTLKAIIKDPSDWDNGVGLACPFCLDDNIEQQKELACEVMKQFLSEHSLIVLSDYAEYSDDITATRYIDSFVLDEYSDSLTWNIAIVSAAIIGPILVAQQI